MKGKYSADPEREAWAQEYRKIDRRIYSFKFDPSKELRFCKASTIKSHILKIQKKIEDFIPSHQLDSERKINNVLSIRKEVKQFERTMTDFTRDAEFLTKLENLAGNIEAKMNGFKQAQMEEFNQIVDEKEKLEAQLSKIERDIEEGVLLHKPKVSSKQGKLTSEIKNLEYQVDYIQDLFDQKSKNGMDYRRSIAQLKRVKAQIDNKTNEIDSNGGINCSWPAKDHIKFTQIVFKLNGRMDTDAFFDECSLLLAIYTEAAVRDHVKIFKVFQGLDTEKKALLEEYKKIKQEIKFCESKYRQEEIKKAEKKESSKIPKASKEERAKQKEKIEKWKREREVKQVINEDKEEELQRNTAHITYLKRKKELDAKKAEIEEFKAIKQMEEIRKQQMMDAQKQETTYMSQEQWERIKMKEERLFEKNMLLKMQKQEKAQQRNHTMQRAMSQNAKKYQNVKPKFKEETTSVMGKQRGKFDPNVDKGKYANNMAGNLVRTTGRAIVAWRQGVG